MNKQNNNTNYNPLEKGNNSINLNEIEDGEIIPDLINTSNKVNFIFIKIKIYIYLFLFNIDQRKHFIF